jgi:hypothetical protein
MAQHAAPTAPAAERAAGMGRSSRDQVGHLPNNRFLHRAVTTTTMQQNMRPSLPTITVMMVTAQTNITSMVATERPPINNIPLTSRAVLTTPSPTNPTAVHARRTARTRLTMPLCRYFQSGLRRCALNIPATTQSDMWSTS